MPALRQALWYSQRLPIFLQPGEGRTSGNNTLFNPSLSWNSILQKNRKGEMLKA